MTNIATTLGSFAEKTSYKAYADLLYTVIIPRAELFGNIIRTSEVLVGAALLLGGAWLLYKKSLPTPVAALLVLALLGGAAMNLNFFLAAGWSSPAVWGINTVMGLIHLILAIAYGYNRRNLS
ncbi:hypothetical protein IPM19_01580 [bacterium]|nr:MAG: hypothetical protein IPM19_01580 [bacterium]